MSALKTLPVTTFVVARAALFSTAALDPTLTREAGAAYARFPVAALDARLHPAAGAVVVPRNARPIETFVGQRTQNVTAAAVETIVH